MSKRALRTLVVATSLLAAMGCTSGTDPDGRLDADPTTPATASAAAPTAAPELERRAAARRALAGATKKMAREKVTAFESTVSVLGQELFAVSGTTSATRSDTTVHSLNPDGEYVDMFVRGSAGVVWMQMDSWPEPMAGCWLELGGTQAPVGIVALGTPEPAYLGLVRYLRPAGYLPGSDRLMVASVRLGRAAVLLTAQTLEEVDLDLTDTRQTLDVRLGVDDRVTFLEMSGADFLRAVEAAGGSVSELAQRALGGMEVVVRYPPPSEDVVPRPPPAPGLSVTAEEMRTGC